MQQLRRVAIDATTRAGVFIGCVARGRGLRRSPARLRGLCVLGRSVRCSLLFHVKGLGYPPSPVLASARLCPLTFRTLLSSSHERLVVRPRSPKLVFILAPLRSQLYVLFRTPSISSVEAYSVNGLGKLKRPQRHYVHEPLYRALSCSTADSHLRRSKLPLD